jgi:uncharacterized protein YidB (DUF937 family)
MVSLPAFSNFSRKNFIPMMLLLAVAINGTESWAINVNDMGGCIPEVVATDHAICADGTDAGVFPTAEGVNTFICTIEQCTIGVAKLTPEAAVITTATNPFASKPANMTDAQWYATCICTNGAPDSYSGGLKCMDGASSQHYPCGTVNPYTVSAVVNSSGGNTAAVEGISAIAKSTSGTQSTSLQAAGDALLTGANNRASVALIGCAAGANEELASAGSGTGNVADCQDNFAKADQMAKMAGKTGKNANLSPDSNVIGSEIGQSTLTKFEKNFGVSQEDYVSRMLSSHGARADFEDMLKAKFSDDRVEKLMTAAAETAPSEEKESTVSSNPAESKKKTDTSLRDSLRSKLVSRELASLKKTQTAEALLGTGFKAASLQPSHALDGVMYGSQDQETEMTIFDVVHQKLREFTARQKL